MVKNLLIRKVVKDTVSPHHYQIIVLHCVLYFIGFLSFLILISTLIRAIEIVLLFSSPVDFLFVCVDDVA